MFSNTPVGVVVTHLNLASETTVAGAARAFIGNAQVP